ncbi:hypothetical protein, partial [Breoghania sp.]|uniref:hypothetical protein n=1 Tax=Breoghania sp. TaxID=2065378 RepID=UPI00260DDC1E
TSIRLRGHDPEDRLGLRFLKRVEVDSKYVLKRFGGGQNGMWIRQCENLFAMACDDPGKKLGFALVEPIKRTFRYAASCCDFICRCFAIATSEKQLSRGCQNLLFLNAVGFDLRATARAVLLIRLRFSRYGSVF